MEYVVFTNASLTVKSLYRAGSQKAASVGKVRPTEPAHMARPTITGENPIVRASGPTMETVVSIPTVADPTAARIIIASRKANRRRGILKLFRTNYN